MMSPLLLLPAVCDADDAVAVGVGAADGRCVATKVTSGVTVGAAGADTATAAVESDCPAAVRCTLTADVADGGRAS